MPPHFWQVKNLLRCKIDNDDLTPIARIIDKPAVDSSQCLDTRSRHLGGIAK
jgi:hypothetical protein